MVLRKIAIVMALLSCSSQCAGEVAFVPHYGSDSVYEIYTTTGTPAGMLILRNGDITKATFVDAIVNAANTAFLGGGGVDGAIHAAADKNSYTTASGSAVTLAQFNAMVPLLPSGERLPLGTSLVSPGLGLTESQLIPYIVSTVGPRGGDTDRVEKIKAAYRSCLDIATSINSLFAQVGSLHVSIPAESKKRWGDNLDLVQKFSYLENGVKRTPLESYYDAIHGALSPAATPSRYKNIIQGSEIARHKAQFLNVIMPRGKIAPITSIAFPLISAAIYGYNIQDSAPHIVEALVEGMQAYATTLYDLQKKYPDNDQLQYLTPFTVIVYFYGSGRVDPQNPVSKALAQESYALTVQPRSLLPLQAMEDQLMVIAALSA